MDKIGMEIGFFWDVKGKVYHIEPFSGSAYIKPESIPGIVCVLQILNDCGAQDRNLYNETTRRYPIGSTAEFRGRVISIHYNDEKQQNPYAYVLQEIQAEQINTSPQEQ